MLTIAWVEGEAGGKKKRREAEVWKGRGGREAGRDRGRQNFPRVELERLDTVEILVC